MKQSDWLARAVTLRFPHQALIDGKAVAFLQSPGIAHPTKSKVEFGCMGKDGFFDDLKVWSAEPAK